MPKKKGGKSLEKNLSIRTGHRKFTEKTIEIAEETVAQSAEVGATTKLKQLKVTLREELEVLKYLDDAVVELTDDDNEIFNDISDAGAFRSKVHETLLKIDESLGVNTANTSQGSSQAPNKVTAVSSILPKLKLKKFSGEVTQWQSFWDSYKSAIHEEKSLNVITKFSYLRDLLEGSAASVIAGLPTTEVNYVSAIELLQRRFGDKQVIISGHHDALLRITPLTSSKNIRDLRELYDKVEVHVRGLQSLDVPTPSYGSLLVPVLLSKIPEDVRLLIGREIKDDKWELGRLLNLLRHHISICEGRQGETQDSTSKVYPSQSNVVTTDAKETAVHLLNEE
eukprot:gene5751-biopygen4665